MSPLRLVISFFLATIILGEPVRNVNSEKKGPDHRLSEELNIPSDMPSEHTATIYKKYAEYRSEKQAKKNSARAEAEHAKDDYPQPESGISPKQIGLKREEWRSIVPLTNQVLIHGGSFWFGSQFEDNQRKLESAKPKDGADARKSVSVKDFLLDVDCVTSEQFRDFASATKYISEAELYGWSFVLDSLAPSDVVEEVDGKTGYGRVKDAKHWMAVKGASWKAPTGVRSVPLPSMPAVHISYKDAVEYCAWAGGEAGLRRLPTEHEWEFAARGGRHNESYPWGKYEPKRMNIWEGKFPTENLLLDGHHGTAPVGSFRAQTSSGLHNMLGNVWEWVRAPRDNKVKSKRKANIQRVLRGGSFIDSLDGSFNHVVYVSTKQMNSADSAASNIGFRCASASNPDLSPPESGSEIGMTTHGSEL